MARIPEDELERLKKNTDLVALVRERGVELKPHGARDLVGLCPMPGHAEKTPSFVVTPGKNLFHCLGCNAAGGPIDFVMKMDGLDFRAAVDQLLKGGPVRRGAAPAPADAHASGGAAALPPRQVVSEERIQVLLERAVAIYQKNFADAPEGRAYLEKRGLSDLGLLQRHQVGYSNGRLPELLPQSGNLRSELASIGLLQEGGRERFTGCIVFAVRDEAGRIVTLYGRYTGTEAGEEGKRHVYLPDRPRGLWNAAALRSSPEIIAVESILDALSVQTAGFANVVSIQSANGSLDVDTLRAQGVQRVRLVLDGDTAGRAGVERLKEKLSGLAVSVATLPEGEDPNSFLVKHGAPKLARVLDPGPADAGASDGAVSLPPRLSGDLTLTFGLRRYEVRGLEKTPRGLKATVRVEKGCSLHVDTLDLYSARARRQLALDLVRVFEESADTIEGDLTKLLSACESAALRGSNAPGQSLGSGAEAPALSASEKAVGEQMGRDPALIETILADYERCGLVGERANKLLCYLAMTSRKMPKPLAVLVLSSSGAGKTALQDAATAFCPPEDLIKLTSLSGKALFYKERTSLKHKVLALEEGDGVQEATYALRNLISAGELVTESTIKDPASGRLVAMENKVEGPTAVFLTTTNPETDPETKSRFFVTSVDESKAQTEAIMAYQRKRYTLDGLKAKAETESVLKKHHAFQRVLQSLDVVNPYAEQLTYGDSRLPSRRDQPKYLGLIAAIAFLRQLQKPKKSYAGRTYVEVDHEDIGLANALATELLGHSLSELSRPGYELLVLLDQMCRAADPAPVDAGASGGVMALPSRQRHPLCFTRRQVREFTGWAHARVHRYLSELLELEYVAVEGGRNGVLHRYQLLWDGQGQDGSRFLLGLRSPDELRPVA